MVHHAAVDMELLDAAMRGVAEAKAVFDCLAAVNVEQLEENTISEMGWLGVELMDAVIEFMDSIKMEGMEDMESVEEFPELTD